MKRAPVALLLVILVSCAFAEEFRFVRPVHVVQNKRAVQKLPPMDVSTFRPGKSGAVTDPPEVTIGERLFMETRFSQFYAASYDGNINRPLKQGDPTLDTVEIAGKPVRGPFKTRSINCRSCHFVAEFASLGINYNRTYADFAQRSRISQRSDGQQTTVRNSMSMVDSFIPRDGATLLHSDGEFASATSLVKSTMTGRNYGWLPHEYDKARSHIAKVVRQDDGTDIISYRYGGAYARVLSGGDPTIHRSFNLPKEYAIDVAKASDQQILDAVAKLVAAYLVSLSFARDNENVHDGSPYDLFLKLNNLPQAPQPGESGEQYTARLAKAVSELKDPKFVDEDKQMTWFQYHDQKFNFGPEELEGLKIFLRTQSSSQLKSEQSKLMTLLLAPIAIAFVGFTVRHSGHRNGRVLCISFALVFAAVGLGGWTNNGESGNSLAANTKAGAGDASLAPHVANCTSCHTAPDFTDRSFHNNGASQVEYDSVHGAGSFATLEIPPLEERNQQPNRYLPATSQHPAATGTFRSVAESDNPNAADLGMWNVFANPDFPEPQAALRKLMCGSNKCDLKDQLPQTIALFRTPSLRDLEDSSPFMHTGRFDAIEDVLRYYIRTSALARQGELRNGAPQLSGITIDEQDIKPLAAFLRSLNEDYD